MCGPSVFDEGYSDFVPEPFAFKREEQEPTQYACNCSCETGTCGTKKKAAPANDMEGLVQTITDQVMAALAGARG